MSSEELKRYNPDVFGDMRENPAGEYVRSLDFDKVAADLQEFKNGNTMALLRAGFAKACDERDALFAQLAAIQGGMGEVVEALEKIEMRADAFIDDECDMPIHSVEMVSEIAKRALRQHRKAPQGA